MGKQKGIIKETERKDEEREADDTGGIWAEDGWAEWWRQGRRDEKIDEGERENGDKQDKRVKRERENEDKQEDKRVNKKSGINSQLQIT